MMTMDMVVVCVAMFISQVHGTARPQSWRRDVTQRRNRRRTELKIQKAQQQFKELEKQAEQ